MIHQKETGESSPGKIPTAEEHLTNNIDYVLEGDLKQDVIDAMISYAKLHVKAALKAAVKNHKLIEVREECPFTEEEFTTKVLNVSSILNAYPENLIV